MPVCSSPLPIGISLLSTVTAIVSCLAFTFFLQRGLAGFAKQINAFVPVGDFSHLVVQVLILLLSVSFIIYLLFIFLSSVKVIRAIPCCGSPLILFLGSCSSQAFLIAWVLLLCFVSSITIVYFIFIGSIYSFCALLDQQCFDFTVLIPAIVSRISNKKVDMVFCAEKKELLCSASNNQLWSLIAAFLCCLITFGGTLVLQNCVVFGLGKRQRMSTKRTEESYELKEVS